MSTPRKLTPEQEREVALTYLCGVDPGMISKEWKVSEATIRSNIVGKRAPQWNDLLVDFYRQTDSRDRARNSAHLYLAYNSRDVPHSELVGDIREAPVYDVVETAIYAPLIQKVILHTGLAAYVIPANGLELLVASSANRDAYNIANTVLLEKMLRHYVSNQPFSLDTVQREVQSSIVDKVKQGGLAITPKKAELIHEVLNTLTERERSFISLAFGLDDGKSRTLAEIAQQYEITRERARQFQAKVWGKLRHPSRSRTLRFVAGLVTDAEIETYRSEMREQEEKKRWYQRLYPEIETDVLQRVSRDPSLLRQGEELQTKDNQTYDSKSIEELELSVRSLNCLDNAQVRTVGELRQKTIAELLKTKNFGRRSILEINEALARIGLSPLRKE